MSQPIHKLFDLLTVELVERIKSGEASSQDLNVARQLLKDCRISAAPEHEPLQILADEVKRFGVAFVRERSKTDRCYGRSTDIHEPLQRSAGGSILEVENTISVCRRCHDWIHSYPEYAVELGLLRYSWQGRENNSE